MFLCVTLRYLMVNNVSTELLRQQYLDGKRNQLIRVYFYINRGVQLVNEFKYVFAGILGIYYTLKLGSPLWIAVMLFLSIPFLAIIGWIAVNKMSKVLDWLGIEFGSYWARYQYTLMEKQVDLLEQIVIKK